MYEYRESVSIFPGSNSIRHFRLPMNKSMQFRPMELLRTSRQALDYLRIDETKVYDLENMKQCVDVTNRVDLLLSINHRCHSRNMKRRYAIQYLLLRQVEKVLN